MRTLDKTRVQFKCNVFSFDACAQLRSATDRSRRFSVGTNIVVDRVGRGGDLRAGAVAGGGGGAAAEEASVSLPETVTVKGCPDEDGNGLYLIQRHKVLSLVLMWTC